MDLEVNKYNVMRTKVILIGAGGKMGMRLTHNLRNPLSSTICLGIAMSTLRPIGRSRNTRLNSTIIFAVVSQPHVAIFDTSFYGAGHLPKSAVDKRHNMFFQVLPVFV